MIQTAQYVGWFVVLAFVVLATSFTVMGFFSLVLSEARQGRELDFDTLLRRFGDSLTVLVKMLFKRWVGVSCSLAVYFMLRSMTNVDFYAALGFSSAAFAVAGVATPAILAALRRVTSNAVQALRNRS